MAEIFFTSIDLDDLIELVDPITSPLSQIPAERRAHLLRSLRAMRNARKGISRGDSNLISAAIAEGRVKRAGLFESGLPGEEPKPIKPAQKIVTGDRLLSELGL